MPEESFILVNLKDNKSKKLAQVISNETSRKILDFLSRKEATETKIAKELGVPISTVHYNLKHLREANLVQVDEFHYSEKGKEVDHYKLSNKFVIIAPETKKIETIKQKLGKILPVALVSLAGAGFVHLFTKGFGRVSMFSARTMAAVSDKAASSLAESGSMIQAAPAAAEQVARESPRAVEYAAQAIPSIALWFLIGSVFAIVAYLVVDLVRKK